MPFSGQGREPLRDLLSGEEDSPVVLPSLKGLDQQGRGASSGGGQLVNHPEDTVHRKPLVGGDSTEMAVSRQQDPPTNTRGNQTEAVVRRQGTVVLRERKGLPDLGRCQIVGDQAMVVEVLPLLIGEAEDFRGTYGQRDHKLVG